MDATGAVAPNVEITLTNSASGFAQARKSSGDGEYSFQQIPPGRYALTAKASGFAQQVRQIELLVNQPARMDIKLTVASASEVVEVTDTISAINTNDATVGTPFNQVQIQAPAHASSILARASVILYPSPHPRPSLAP